VGQVNYYTDFFEERRCPACGSRDSDRAGTLGYPDKRRCQSCFTLFSPMEEEEKFRAADVDRQRANTMRE
jgi:hypothetical protein